MKLWKRILLLVLTVQVLSFAGFSIVFLKYMEQKQILALLETREEHMDNLAEILEKVTEVADYSDMTEITKRSMAAFYLKKYAPEGYAVTGGETILASTCDYEITPYQPWYEKDKGTVFHTMQTIYHKTYLILSENVTLWQEKYALYGTKDITFVYAELKQMALRLFTVGMLILSITCLILIISIKKMFSPLKQLTTTAKSIQEGDYKARSGSLSEKQDEIGTLAYAFDQMAEEIERHISELKEGSLRQQQLLGALSHEIKTPVTSLIGYSDTLLHVKLSEEQKEQSLNRIYEESKRMERLSSKLMSLIGLYENDAIRMEWEKIGTVMNHVKEAIRYSLEEKEIKADFFWEDFSMKMDVDLMESLLLNLIDNSKKASPPGSRIEIRAEKGTISVRDFGCGISKEELKKVKEPFYMVDKARKKREGNIGLGLALCNQIAMLHGGRLEIESRIGEGTCVSFLFYEK